MDSLSQFAICPTCGAQQNIDFKFCTHCGKRNVNAIKKEHLKDNWFRENLNSLLIYSIFSIMLLLVAAFTEESIEILVLWSVGFAIVDLFFAAYQPQVFKLLNLRKIQLLPLLSIIAFCTLSAFIVYFSMEWLNNVIQGDTTLTIQPFLDLDHPLLYSIIVIAVFPAIFEELAFRGFVFNNFKVIGGHQSAIWGSAFLFALVHFSLLSLVWLLPFGLLLSHFRNKYSTILYGMVGHFIHNSTVVLIEYYLR
jgi:membrane protease YdiL (CAAX protease family)